MESAFFIFRSYLIVLILPLSPLQNQAFFNIIILFTIYGKSKLD
ncbi:hypothetical protein BTJ48_04542 [Bacillus mycoides]|nr:hypothetical protein BTJ48_04542 [Bacillus mycoides]